MRGRASYQCADFFHTNLSSLPLICLAHDPPCTSFHTSGSHCLTTQEAELAELRRGINTSVGSGSTDQQLMAAERELSQASDDDDGARGLLISIKPCSFTQLPSPSYSP